MFDASAPLQKSETPQASSLTIDYAKFLESSPLSLRKRHKELQRGSQLRLDGSREKKSELVLSAAEKEL